MATAAATSTTKKTKRKRDHPARTEGAPTHDASSDSPGARVDGGGSPENARETVARVMEIERDRAQPESFSQHASDKVTAFSGSMLFVWLHVAWYGGWIFWNVAVPPLAFDPIPFSFLTLVVSLEAIFLSTFVLISQNRQSRRADERSMVDLEVNVIAEQELTKLFKLVADIHKHLGPSDEHDPEVEDMLKSIDVGDLIQQTSEENAEGSDP